MYQGYGYSGQQNASAKKMIENFSYGLTNQIGKGFSSKVFKGQNELNGETVAIKVIDKSLLKTPLHHALLQSEIEALSTLDCQHIMKLYKVFQTQNNTYLITEFCEGGDLGGKLQKSGKFSEQSAQSVICGVIKAYKQLKEKGIIHRDIKPANVLLSDGVPKMADFGFATTPNSPPLLPNVNVGSPLYMSPQALKNNKYSEKSDIWAIGVTAFEILFGQVPWQAQSEKELASKMLAQPVVFPISVRVSNDCKDFIRRCLVVSESERAGVDELIDHPWLRSELSLFHQNKLQKAKTVEYKDNREYRQGKENSDKKPAVEIRSQKKHATTKVNGHGKQLTKIFDEEFSHEYVINSQLNFCKYLNKITQLIEQTNLFSQDLQSKLLFFVTKNVMLKIHKLQDLDNNPLDLSEYESFKLSNAYPRLQKTVQHAYQQHITTFSNVWMSLQSRKAALSIDKKFDAVFDENFTEFESFYIIFNSVLRQGIRELHKELDRRMNRESVSCSLPNELEKEVVLLDYLVTYFQLSQLVLDTFTKPAEFATKSKIEHIAEGNPVRLTYGHFVEIKNKMNELEI